MATRGPRRGGGVTSQTGGATRQQLVDAAVAALRDVGFAGASAREIADRAGVSQGSIFYHFGSVNDLLLAALDHVSADRLSAYSDAVSDAGTVAELVTAARGIHDADLADGHTRFLVALIAGAQSSPGLGDEVATRLEPWREFTRSAVGRALDGLGLSAVVDAGDAARIVMATILGMELLASLDGDQAASGALFDRARDLAALLGTPPTSRAGGAKEER